MDKLLIGFDQHLFPDHDRPLSSTGQADAIKVSQKLHLLGWIPELILSRFVCLRMVK